MSFIINPQGEAAITLPDPQTAEWGEIGSSITFTWPHFLRNRIPELRAVEARRINSGIPRANRSGAVEAVCDPPGKICTFVWQEQQGTQSMTGIFVVVTAAIGAGGWTDQTLSIVCFKVDTLLHRGTGERFDA